MFNCTATNLSFSKWAHSLGKIIYADDVSFSLVNDYFLALKYVKHLNFFKSQGICCCNEQCI